MELRGNAVFGKFSSVILLCALPLLSSLAAEIGAGVLSAGQHEFEKIVQEQKEAQQQWQQAYEKAQTKEEKSALKYPRNEQYASRILAVAKKYPDDPAALDALVWVAQNCHEGEELDAALPLLLEKYPNEPRVGEAVSRLLFARSKEVEAFLRGIAEKSWRGNTKGKALITLGRMLKEQAESAQFLRTNTEPKRVEDYRRWIGEDVVKKLQAADAAELRKEAEALFETVINKYGKEKSTSRTLGESAKGELFEMRHLQIGMVAPGIKGEDLEGKKFALSDYRGKVVVLDFWGHW